MSPDRWRRVRIALYGLAFVLGLIVPVGGGAEFRTMILERIQSLPGWMIVSLAGFTVLIVLTIPLMLLVVVGIQVINPMSDKTWHLHHTDRTLSISETPCHSFISLRMPGRLPGRAP
ncbi:MAG: hypothetical protein ACODAQ_00505 [Phycisphaeraceae bacterium]